MSGDSLRSTLSVLSVQLLQQIRADGQQIAAGQLDESGPMLRKLAPITSVL